MMDFPRAWEIARSTPIEQHYPRCSYRQESGALLCDCAVLTRHPEYLRDYGGRAMTADAADGRVHIGGSDD